MYCGLQAKENSMTRELWLLTGKFIYAWGILILVFLDNQVERQDKTIIG